jgi:hypothetical protein
MYRNAETGKGWTPDEESAFEQIARAGDIERLSAIRLWKRCRQDLTKALRLAQETYALTPAQRERNRTSAVRLSGLRKQVSAVA